MSLLRLCLRNLLYHARANAAVLLGVTVGCAVLTGALLVGDSLRGSLREQSLERLGWVEQALVAPRFFRAALADELKKDGALARAEPALMLQATAEGPGAPADRQQARGVTVLGVTEGFAAVPSGDVVWLSRALADALAAKEGDRVTLFLQKPSAVPREAALGSRKVETEAWDLKVGKVLGPGELGNAFNLRPELQAPRNALVPLAALQEKLGQKGRANAILGAGAADLDKRLQARLKLDDWGLRLRGPKERADDLFARYDHNADGVLSRDEYWDSATSKPTFAGLYAKALGVHLKTGRVRGGPLTRDRFESYFEKHYPYLSLESRQLLIEPVVGKAALRAAQEAKLDATPMLVYLCRIQAGTGPRSAGVVAAVPAERMAHFAPRLLKGKALADDEIVLVEEGWRGPRRKAGTAITLVYKPPEHQGGAADRHRELKLVGMMKLAGAAADPMLTPEFPGITDRDNAGEWKLPFDDPKWDTETVRKEYTDRYWDDYRTAPRAYVTLKAGQEMWASRFGDLTSVLLTPADGAAKERFEAALLRQLEPAQGGFVFEDVKATSLQASGFRGWMDFGQLFLYFSFFLIVAALLLVALLFRLNLDRRAREVGLYFAEGFRRRVVRGLLLGEGALVALAGVVLGTLLALAYSLLLVKLLAALWPGGELRSLLRPHAEPLSLAAGGAGALLVSVLTIFWVVRSLSRVPPRALLAGQTTGEGEAAPKAAGKWSLRISLVALVLGLASIAVGPFLGGHYAQAGSFFTGGGLLLTAALAGLSAWLRGRKHATLEAGGWWGIARLGARNAARHPTRSLLTAGLLASAAFVIVAVEVFRRHAPAAGGGKDAADGGFALLGESDLPVVRELDSKDGRAYVLAQFRRELQAGGLDSREVNRRLASARELLDDEQTRIIGLRVHGGDDASCLNLYQPRRPRVIGVPDKLIERGGFRFAGTKAKAEEKANPWMILRRSEGPVPAFGEKNTVEWVLKSGLGGTVAVPDGRGKSTDLQIAGLLDNSVFQSGLLISEARFLRLYPETEGYQLFLIQAPPGREAELKQLLEHALADRGLGVTPSRERLEAYLAVENTYLSTFQALGGLGLVLGSLGLAVVLLRAVWERRAELALLRALGFRRLTLGWLVLAENGFLLLVGLAAGTAAALLAVLPHLVTGAGSVPWAGLAALLAVVLLVGLGAGSLAVWATLRAPLLPALRRE
jgi:ABC-type lipoprotein release transport system permease subunit